MTEKSLVGTVYLLHFDPMYGHAQHYIGFTELTPEQRLEDYHKKGIGAKLVNVVHKAGHDITIARIWENSTRSFERGLKNRKNAKRLCPICKAQANV